VIFVQTRLPYLPEFQI